MGVMYFKRYRMEIDLTLRRVARRELPEGYRFVSWRVNRMMDHAETKFQSFRSELDANVFPCLGNREGCFQLMEEIIRKPSFLPNATWLIRYDAPVSNKWEYCGTVQGIRDKGGFGAIQNLGITPEHRNRHLGTCLLQQALEGFRQSEIDYAMLEVTARNSGAIRLYQRMGFTNVRTVYKMAEVNYV